MMSTVEAHETYYFCPDCSHGDIRVLPTDDANTIAQCDFCSFEASVGEVLTTCEQIDPRVEL